MNWGWRGNTPLRLYNSTWKLYSNKVAVLETVEKTKQPYSLQKTVVNMEIHS